MIHTPPADIPFMLCPKCKTEWTRETPECPRCGIVFGKYRGITPWGNGLHSGPPGDPTERTERGFLQSLLLDVEEEVNPFSFGGRVLLFLVLVLLGVKLAFASHTGPNAGGSFLHLVNLPFHEAGHLVFRPMGRFMTSLGGSLGQLMMPLVCLTPLLITRRDNFGASACLWWFGQNFIDLAPYIGDARSLSLPLLGGNTGAGSPYGFHDWEFILTEAGLLPYDHLLAAAAHQLGVLVMGLALLWGGYILFLQYKNLD